MRTHMNHMAILLLMVLTLLPESYAQSSNSEQQPFLEAGIHFGSHSTDSKVTTPIHTSPVFIPNEKSNDTSILRASAGTSEKENRKLDTNVSGSRTIVSFLSPFTNFQSPDASESGVWRFVQDQGTTIIDRPIESHDSTDIKWKNLFDDRPQREVQASSFGKNFQNFHNTEEKSANIKYNPYTRVDESKHFPPQEKNQPVFNKNDEFQPPLLSQKEFQEPSHLGGQGTEESPKAHEVPDFEIQRGQLHHYEQVQFHPTGNRDAVYYDVQENQNDSQSNPAYEDYTGHTEIYDYSDGNGDIIYDYVAPENYYIANEEKPLNVEANKQETIHNQEKLEPTSSGNASSVLENESTNSYSESKSLGQPKNLATLLADSQIVHINNPPVSSSTSSSIGSRELESPTVRPKTRKMVPEHIKLLKKDETPEYYDYLYDEFLNMYYYDDKESSQKPESTTPNATETTNQSLKTTQAQKVLKYTTTAPSSTSRHPERSSPSTRKTTTTPPTFTKSLLQSTTVTTKSAIIEEENSSNTPANKPTVISTPLSLSEILQELDLTLPQFLATLKTHGTSLKEFTQKLEKNSISKTDFRRTKGSVKKLLEILNGTNNRGKSRLNNSSRSPIAQKSTTSKPASTVNSKAFDSPSDSTQVVLNTKIQENRDSASPVLFGSQPTGIEFLRPNENKATIEIDSASRPIKANISLLSSNTKDVLHSLDEISDISDINKAYANNTKVVSTTQSSINIHRKTTTILRPYRKNAERPRPYRPYDANRGNPKIHRGVINSRLSSTARPTLRPPYSPPQYYPIENGKKTTKSIFTSSSPLPTKKNSFDPYKTFNNGGKSHNYNEPNENTDIKQVSAKSAIMAAAILGAVALSVFIAIFIVVKYRSHISRHKRRSPLGVPSDTSTSSIPPIYGNRAMYSRECYQTSGFWTSLKKKFDPYSPSSSPMYM